MAQLSATATATAPIDQAQWRKLFDIGYPTTSNLWNKKTSDHCMISVVQKTCYIAAAAIMAVIETVGNALAIVANAGIGTANGVYSYFADKKVEPKNVEANANQPPAAPPASVAASVQLPAPVIAEPPPAAPVAQEGAPPKKAVADAAAANAVAGAAAANAVADAAAANAVAGADKVKRCPPMIDVLAKGVALGNKHIWRPLLTSANDYLWQPAAFGLCWFGNGIVDLTKAGYAQYKQFRPPAAPQPAPVAPPAAPPAPAHAAVVV